MITSWLCLFLISTSSHDESLADTMVWLRPLKNNIKFLKPGLDVSCKDGKHMVANTFFKLFTYAFVFGIHIVAMITCNSIHISQEIFAIDVLTALKSSLEQCQKHVLGLLWLYGDQAQADQCKEQFFWSHNKQVLFVVFCRESYINNPIT